MNPINSVLNWKQFNSLTDIEKTLFLAAINNQNIDDFIGIQKNWGIVVFKPPRASLYLFTELREIFFTLLKEHRMRCLGQYKVQALTRNHIFVMYPGDSIMPYWLDLERMLVGQPAYYFLIQSSSMNDMARDITLLKGWYKIDKSRGRLTSSEGLRHFFRQLVEKHEVSFREVTLGSAEYEDSGIHAPCSLKSRLLQLLGLMVVDANFAKFVRSHLDWLTTL